MEKAQEATPRTAWGQFLVLQAEQLRKNAVSLAIHLNTLNHRQPASQQDEYRSMLRHLTIADNFLTRAVSELDKLGYTHGAGGQPDAR